MTKHRTCSKCGETKVLELFPRQRKNKDGRDSRCKSCAALNSHLYRQNNLEKVREQQRNLGRLNAKERDARVKKWMEENKERRRAWREANKERISNQYRAWRLLNPDKMKAKRAKRRAMLKNARPSWVNDADFLPIYRQRDEITLLSGQEHHVDHIVPLQGKNVCGLHVPWNLQVLLASLNHSKKNRWLEGYVWEGAKANVALIE